jgi:hypothetical protein
VLHPEHLAGEAAIEVASPEPPPGFEKLAAGRMGELQIRVTLERCNSRPEAARAAAGWGGDAYAIVRDRDGASALVWSTAWDSESEAVEFEQAALRTVRCWKQGDRVEGALFSGQSRLLRRGSNVALVRGLAAPDPTLTKLVELPRAALPAVPPFGLVTIPAVRQLPPTRPPFVDQGRYVNEKLGIVAPVLPGYGVDIDRDGTLTLSRQWPTPATGFVGISDWMVTPGSVDETFRRFAEGVQRAVDEVADAEIEISSDPGRVRTPLGMAVERVWAVKRGNVRIRLLLLPICGGTGSLLFAQLWADAAARPSSTGGSGASAAIDRDAAGVRRARS